MFSTYLSKLREHLLLSSVRRNVTEGGTASLGEELGTLAETTSHPCSGEVNGRSPAKWHCMAALSTVESGDSYGPQV